MIVIKRKTVSEPVSLYRRLILPLAESCASTPVVSQMRGNSEAKCLIIAPPLTPDEYLKGVPLSGIGAVKLHTYMQCHGLDSDRHFLIVSCSYYGEKACKASTHPFIEFIQECAKLSQFRYFVCCGSETFKWIFGGGKKPASTTLFGSEMFMQPLAGKPMFTIPHPDTMTYQWNENFDDRDNRRAAYAAEKAEEKFNQWAEKLAARMKEFKAI